MSRQTPIVSIGLPVFNGARYLAEAIESVLAQTMDDFELIIADNASTDDTAQICKVYMARDARIQYVRNETNIGAHANHRLVCALARGQYFRWLAADDICAPSFLAECVKTLTGNPLAVLAYPIPDFIDVNGHPVDALRDAFHHTTWSPVAKIRFRQLIEEYMYSGGITAGLYSYGLIRLDMLRQTRVCPGYMGSDWITVAELILRGTFIELPHGLSFIRAHPGSAYGGAFEDKPAKAQEYLNPLMKGAWRVRLAGAWRYLEHFNAVSRSPLSVADQRELFIYLAWSMLRRAYRRALRKPVPWQVAHR